MQFPRNANDCHFFYPFHLLGEATGHMSHLFFWNQPKPSVFLLAINSSSKSTELGQISRYHMMFPSTWRAPFLRTSPFFQRPTSAVKRIGNERYNLNRSEWASECNFFPLFRRICHCALGGKAICHCAQGRKVHLQQGAKFKYIRCSYSATEKVQIVQKGPNTRSFNWQILFNGIPCSKFVTSSSFYAKIWIFLRIHLIDHMFKNINGMIFQHFNIEAPKRRNTFFTYFLNHSQKGGWFKKIYFVGLWEASPSWWYLAGKDLRRKQAGN